MSIINTKGEIKKKRKVLLTIITMLVIIIGFGYWKFLVCKVFQKGINSNSEIQMENISSRLIFIMQDH